MRDSPAWRLLGEGVPRDIEPDTLRAILHAYRQIILTLTAHVDMLRDRDDTQALELEELDAKLDAHWERLTDAENGRIPNAEKRANDHTDAKVGKLLGPGMIVAGSVATYVITTVLRHGGVG